MWTWEMVALLLAVGAFAGVIAGLFGVGGGMILVPVVLWALQMQGLTDLAHAQHLAIGTSFAVMVFTSFSECMVAVSETGGGLGGVSGDGSCCGFRGGIRGSYCSVFAQ